MFIGHYAVGFGAKSVNPKVSLGTYFLAAQFIDLLWPTLLLLGIEHATIAPGITRFTPLDFTSYPISHSLLMVLIWALLFGAIHWIMVRRTKEAMILGACVVSHWLLDLTVHRPDLPLYPGDSPRVGMGLWNSIPGTLLFEGALFVIGIILYLRATAPRNRAGQYGLWSMIAVLLIAYLGNAFGPPPPSAEALAWTAQAQWLLVIWAYWVDKNRVAKA